MLSCYTYAVNCGYCTRTRTRGFCTRTRTCTRKSYCTRNIPGEYILSLAAIKEMKECLATFNEQFQRKDNKNAKTRTSETLNRHPRTPTQPLSNLSALSTIGWCPENFVTISLTILELSRWQTEKHTNKQCWKQYTLIALIVINAADGHLRHPYRLQRRQRTNSNNARSLQAIHLMDYSLHLHLYSAINYNV